MKIIVRASNGENMWLDYRKSLEIKISEEDKITRRLSFYDGEPEDNNLNRNFSDVYSIPGLMQLAFEAGKAGQTFEIVEEEPEK